MERSGLRPRNHGRIAPSTSIRQRAVGLGGAIVLTASGGCMTYVTQDPYWRGTAPGEWSDMYFILVTRDWYVYGGTINDLSLFFQLPVLTWIDLPLSLAADTVLLPLTIYQQACPNQPERKGPQPDDQDPAVPPPTADEE